jgi:hypothetical protein
MNLKLLVDKCNELNFNFDNIDIDDGFILSEFMDQTVFINTDNYYSDDFDLCLILKNIDKKQISNLNQCFLVNENMSIIYLCFGDKVSISGKDVLVLSDIFKFASLASNNKSTSKKIIENLRIYNIFDVFNLKYDDDIFRKAIKNFVEIHKYYFDMAPSNFIISKNSFKYSMVSKLFKHLELLS